MSVTKISANIYDIGVVHRDLQVFDLLMPLPHGTTYNSFLITGEKNVIIDTSKLMFAGEFIKNIKEVIDPAKIDYIVIQHNELDHAGSLPALLAVAPNAKVVISKAAENFLVNSFNTKFEYIKVDDASEIKIGPNQTLKFFIAPFLHWPDTMFTHYVEEQALFTCDAFGAHYCQQKGIFTDEMSDAEYKADYSPQFKVYFEIIMRVYSEKVLSAIRKIENAEIKLLCPSHGPLIRKNIKEHINYYKNWAATQPDKTFKKVSIVYSSMYGSTMKMAYHMESLLKEHGMRTFVAEIPFNMTSDYMTNVIKEISSSDGVLFGSSTICSTILKPMWDFLFFLATVEMKGKLAGIFGSYGWDARGLQIIELVLSNYKMNMIKNVSKIKFVPSADKLETCVEFINEFAAALAKSDEAPKTASAEN
ncbi:MAG TPA: FprA family A-type flavoprotein [Candidatus Wallbacteria bacterium]|nr:FprA family A-type flavoprotein [Candidatus Wallbacteria bacterium]